MIQTPTHRSTDDAMAVMRRESSQSGPVSGTVEAEDRDTGGLVRISGSEIARFIGEALRAVGLPDADAVQVGELMAEADVIGADAHGIFRLPQYVKRIRAGGVNVTPRIAIEKTGPATAVVDGDNGMGHLVMARAAETAVALARDAGVAWVGARRSNHAGPAAFYAAMPVEHGMIGVYSAVASANHMAPWGGVEPLLGTNPIAFGIPLGDAAPLVLDIATTVVSYGTVKNHVLQGKALPDDWLTSKLDGQPITDPARVGEGLLRAIGGYKGSGLALVLGLLAGTLNGAVFGRDVIDFNADAKTEANTGQFIVALDVARFIPPKVFAREAQRHLDDIRASEPLPNAGPVRVPGDMRARRRAERLEAGVPVPRLLAEQLSALAAELSVEPPRLA